MNNVELFLRDAEKLVENNRNYEFTLNEEEYKDFSKLILLYKGFKIQERIKAEISYTGIKREYHLTISRRKK